MTFQVRTSLLENVDGSAELQIGNTKVITSVTGPIEPKARQDLPNQASLEIVIRPAVDLASTREKLLEDKLRSLLQSIIVRYKYPRQLIQIVVQFLVSDTSSEGEIDYTSNELNAAINCCYFALIDAGVALSASFASLSISLNDGKATYNPSLVDLNKSDSHHVICFNIVKGKADKILLLESQGDIEEEELFTMISNAVSECEVIHQQQRKFIKEKVDNDYVWKQ
ncbi:exosome complex exonuclease RRP46 [Scheffersomyces xylosifermentans]|uniref:exosome complex exonuclease RRP46 n=1 Tax=Scheffersomyces xylosifermentans TaxID=1304137 RepID=UPI00315D6A69